MRINKTKTVTFLIVFSLLIYSCETRPLKVHTFPSKSYTIVKEVSFDPDSLRDVTNLPQGDNTYRLEEGVLYLAPQSKVTLKLESYCLDPHKASPATGELYIPVPGTPHIPLYKEMMLYFFEHPEINQKLKQQLIWNLANEVKFEDLSLEERQLLLKIDPQAPLKVNTFLKALLKEKAKEYLGGLVPKRIQEAIEVVKGKYYSYKDYERQVESLRSRIKEPPLQGIPPQPIGETGLYVIAKAGSYSKITVEVYNPSKPSSVEFTHPEFSGKGGKVALEMLDSPKRDKTPYTLILLGRTWLAIQDLLDKLGVERQTIGTSVGVGIRG